MRHGLKIFDSDTHLMMEFDTVGPLEPAAAVGVILSAIAIGVALIARRLGLRVLSESS